MRGFENTELWRTTLGVTDGDDATARERLRSAYLLVRERAAVLAAEIPLDLREYTVHDSTHLDALWETADEIVGATVSLNPAEAFVLGCAFLIHDLGMGLAAYPDGMETLRAMDAWPSILAASIEQATGAPPSAETIVSPPDAALRLAKDLALRELHARHAETLAHIDWTSSTGSSYHLIEDQGLRDVFGPLIGRIAHSHWWDISRLQTEFTEVGSSVELPADWRVNSLLLACILRLADASHLDSRRAPGYLMALRRPQGVANEHWTFQTHLQRMHRKDDRLYYSSTHRFTTSEASAWWLCLETLRMVDRELRGVDALLADTGSTRLAARGVFGVEDPARLSNLIPTDGWIPVDARVVVGDVSGLVLKLGGAELYGDNPEVALRELIANASDAVCYRALLDHGDDYTGHVTIRLDERPDGYFLEVSDNGIGMSEEVMTGALLDFGRSFWGSSLMRKEFPNLVTTGYKATGRYGIGFFSVFMVGSHVEVRSRRFDLGADDTRVLEFQRGLDERPLLRKALRSERLSTGGTLIRVRLHTAPQAPGGLYQSAFAKQATLRDLVSWLAPASPVELRVADVGEGTPAVVVGSSDWLTLAPDVLFERLYGGPFDGYHAHHSQIDLSDCVDRLQTVEADDTPVARLAVALPGNRRHYRPNAVVTVGGLRAGHVTGIVGVVQGEPDRAARDLAVPNIPNDVARTWACDQLDRIDLSSVDELRQLEVAALISCFGVALESLPVCLTADGLLNMEKLSSWAAEREMIEVVWGNPLISEYDEEGCLCHFAYGGGGRYVSAKMLDSVLIVEAPSVWIQDGMNSRIGASRRWPYGPQVENEDIPQELATWWGYYEKMPVGVAIRCVAQAWGCGLLPVLQGLEQRDSYEETTVIATCGDNKNVNSDVVCILRRPAAS